MAGIYLHIPFCKQACTYCNFHFITSLKQKPAYLEALLKEILLTKDFFAAGTVVESVYFGGGTPGILAPPEIETILQHIRQYHTLFADAEITLEANPDDCSLEKLKAWKHIGINRLSIGTQSFDEAELKWMNRAHNAEQSALALQNIKAAGFRNFTADLIYGSPLQSLQTLEYNIQQLLKYDVPHLSCYALTVEEKTALHHLIENKRSPGVDAEHQAKAFELLTDLLEANGYEQYEISNFARPGYRSRHNSSYWQGKPYLGLGASAHSYNGSNSRRWNIANNALYINSINNNIVPFEEEILTPAQQLNEYIMTSLRTAEGMDLEKIKDQQGEAMLAKIAGLAHHYLQNGLLIQKGRQLVVTPKGKFLADGIAAALFV